MDFSRPPSHLQLRSIAATTRTLALVVALLAAVGSPASAQGIEAPETEAAEGDSPEAEQVSTGEYVLTVPELLAPAELDRLPWDLQWNGRIGMGFGLMMQDQSSEGFVYEMIVRFDALWGQPGDEHARVGVGLDLRAVLSGPPEMGDAFDMGGVLVGLIPTWRGFPIQLSAGGGYGIRADQWKGGGLNNGGFFLGTFAWGYRSYNYHDPSHYQMAINAYFSTRVHTTNANTYEMTFGITFDLALAFYLPTMWVMQKVVGSEDDPVPEDDDEWRTEPVPTVEPGFDPDARFRVEDDDDDSDGDDPDAAQD